ncbi:MAG: rRNA (adenine1518-N6/adenine1519-N6)-dimethyltransferase [Clostridia bacterium]|nr:rRNA (adenine1518-N6/adenine1519-N6)-dimethyltransferase [Clostridia bacterium]
MEESVAAPGRTKAILRQRNLVLKEAWGQNFLVDANLARKIVRLAEITPEEVVVEIGPGIGALTQELAKVAGLVLAIEKDERLLPVLAEILAEAGNVKIVSGDALKADFDGLVAEALKIEDRGRLPRYKIVANLPYYITTPLLFHLLEGGFCISSMVLMVQKEVGKRLQAAPGSKEYGALTVAVNYYAEVEVLVHVPRTVFWPRPEVDSVVLRSKIRDKPVVDAQPEALFRIVRAAFGRRRKTILNALGALGLPREFIAKALVDAGIDPGRRGETLSLQEFARLANCLEQQKEGAGSELLYQSHQGPS